MLELSPILRRGRGGESLLGTFYHLKLQAQHANNFNNAQYIKLQQKKVIQGTQEFYVENPNGKNHINVS